MSDASDDVIRRIEDAANEGRHTEAFELLRGDLVKQALEWFLEAGIRFVPSGPQMPTEFAVSLAMAAHKAIEELGDPVPLKLHAGATALDAIANLRTVLAKEVPEGEEAGDRLAEVLMSASALGAACTMVGLVRLGHFETLVEFEMDRERRRAGAEKTNRKRATDKEKALSAAIAILGTNPTLSADEAAPKIRERAGLSLALRTIAQWVREWRRDGTIGTASEGSAS